MPPELMTLIEELRQKLEQILNHPQAKNAADYIDLIKHKVGILETYIEEELQDETLENKDEEEGN